MEQWVSLSIIKFDEYIDSFSGLSMEQQTNFAIKKDHSLRVAEIAAWLADKLKLTEAEKSLAFAIGLFHDIGRFKQLVEFGTFNDAKSVDHADYSVQVLKQGDFLNGLSEKQTELLLTAIEFHNKREIPKTLTEEGLLFAKIIRDADKLDIFKVITDYYANSKATPNHTLTWEMPKGSSISTGVAKQILSGILVSKDKIENEMDIKIMQLSWVYDINFKATFEAVVQKRFLEKIYNSMSKNDQVIEIYRKVKVYTENELNQVVKQVELNTAKNISK
jgi:putative nucleotidyltransferase with HDIG domain